MTESELERVFNYSKFPRDSKKCSDRRFLKIDNGSMGGTQ